MSWHTPQPVETQDGDATEPRVAMDGGGRAAAIWTQAAGGVSSIWSSRTAGSGWAAAVQVDVGAAPSPHTPLIVVSDNGNAVALWTRGGGFFDTNLFRNGAWGTPQTLLNSGPISQFYGPVLSGSRDGAALVAWASTAGRGSSLVASTLSGTTWTTVALPLATSPSFPTMGNVRAATGPNGERSVLWSQTASNGTTFWLNQFRGGAWGTPLAVDPGASDGFDMINDPLNDGFGEAGLAVVRGPAEVVAWKSPTAIWANQHTSTWTGAVKIRDLPAGATVTRVQGVSDARGNAAFAIWLENDRVWASAFSGNTWGPAVNIEAVTTGAAASPSIALEPSGSAVAVWSHAAAPIDIWANRYTPGSGWGTAVRIDTDDAGDATAPSVAVDTRGNAQAVWQQSDGTRINVFGSRFD